MSDPDPKKSGRWWKGGRKKAPPGENRVHLLNIRGTSEWRAWLDDFAAFCRQKRSDSAYVSDLVDAALRDYARDVGFHEEAPRR